jgi:hypothetical protein
VEENQKVKFQDRYLLFYLSGSLLSFSGTIFPQRNVHFSIPYSTGRIVTFGALLH